MSPRSSWPAEWTFAVTRSVRVVRASATPAPTRAAATTAMRGRIERSLEGAGGGQMAAGGGSLRAVGRTVSGAPHGELELALDAHRGHPGPDEPEAPLVEQIARFPARAELRVEA